MAVYVETIPIPKVSQKNQQPLVRLIDKIIAAKKVDPETDISATEKAINELVYKLYGLTEDEIKAVKETLQPS